MRRLLPLLALTLGIAAWPAAPAQADAGWSWPLHPAPTLVRGFEPPPQPWLPGHRGVDLAGRPGATVRAAGAGIVSFAGRVAGIPVVSLAHPDGLTTTYEPVTASVREGQRVREGEALGRLARVGGHCLPDTCLHWGLRRDDSYLDPLVLLGLTHVRLLPFANSADDSLASHAWAPAAAALTAAGFTVPWATRRRGRRCTRHSPTSASAPPQR